MNISLPVTLWRTAPSVHPDPTWGDKLARLKYCLRGLFRPRLTADWFHLLHTPELRVVRERHPRVLSKLQRPYLCRRLGAKQRLAALREHYEFVADLLVRLPEAADIFSARGRLLARLPVTNLGEYSLRLCYSDRFEKEGDLTVALLDEVDGAPLFTLTFAITRNSGATREMFIGGIQGCRETNQRERIVSLTRELHGLRPKALLVFVAQRLAQIWNVTTLRAVSDAEHIYRHFRKRRTFSAGYDEFWRECQGEPGPDGLFTLPAAPTVRNIAELPRNKRPVYRRRYLMLENLGEEIRANLLAGVVPHIKSDPGDFPEPDVISRRPDFADLSR
jgi:uncharacterized protein